MSGLDQVVSGTPRPTHRSRRGGRINPLRCVALCYLALAATTTASTELPGDSKLDESSVATVTADQQAVATAPPVTLIGVGAVDLLGDIPPPTLPGRMPANDPFEFPDVTPGAPVAIPFPTAIHLFVPGALMVIYATRRFRRRR